MSIFSIYGKRVGLTGGSSGDLDEIASGQINDGDKAIVVTNEVTGGEEVIYIYEAEASSGKDEDVPWIVKPDDETGDLRWVLVSMSNPNVLFMTAWESIDAGKAVRIISDTGVAKTANCATLTEGEINTFSDVMTNSSSSFYPTIAATSGGTLLCMYLDVDAFDLMLVAGTVSGNTMSWGTAITLSLVDTWDTGKIVYDPDEKHFVAYYQDDDEIKFHVGSVAGTTLSIGTRGTVEDGTNIAEGYNFDACYDTNNNVHALMFSCKENGTNIYRILGYAGTLTGGAKDTMTWSTGLTCEDTDNSTNPHSNPVRCYYHDDDDRVIWGFVGYGGSDLMLGDAGVNNVPSITFGALVTYCTAHYGYSSPVFAYDSNSGFTMLVGRDDNNTNDRYEFFSVEMGSIIPGGSGAVNTSYYQRLCSAVNTDDHKYIFGGWHDTGDYIAIQGYDPYPSLSMPLPDSNNSATLTPGNANTGSIEMAYDPSSGKLVMVMYNSSADDVEACVINTATYTNNRNYAIGIAEQAASAGSVHPITLLGGVSFYKTGMTPGDLYYIDDDGSIATTVTDYPIGRALSANELLLGKDL